MFIVHHRVHTAEYAPVLTDRQRFLYTTWDDLAGLYLHLTSLVS